MPFGRYEPRVEEIIDYLLFGRILSGVTGTLLCVLLLGIWIVPPTEAHLVVLAIGATTGVLLYFARTGFRRPWAAAFFLPGLYLVQIPAIYLALRHFPHHRSIHCLSSLGASALFLLAVAKIRRAVASRSPLDPNGHLSSFGEVLDENE